VGNVAGTTTGPGNYNAWCFTPSFHISSLGLLILTSFDDLQFSSNQDSRPGLWVRLWVIASTPIFAVYYKTTEPKSWICGGFRGKDKDTHGEQNKNWWRADEGGFCCKARFHGTSFPSNLPVASLICRRPRHVGQVANKLAMSA